MSITEFLLARIEQDERAAMKLAETDNRPVLSLAITVNHPERILAECAAKRAIIKQHEAWPVLVERPPVTEAHSTGPQGVTYRMSQSMALLTEREYVRRFGVEPPTAPMIRILAAIYSDHPDYQEKWKP